MSEGLQSGTELVLQAEHGNALDFRKATDAAQLCKQIVVATAITIASRKYVRVEGWQAIAIAHGCVASSGEVERIPEGIRAIGTIRRGSDGMIVAQAEGFVGDDEETWGKRQEYAKRAMAQTRAISRACRSAFAHVVVMMQAGLQTTPAEEVPQEGFEKDDLAKAPVAMPKAKSDPDSDTNTAQAPPAKSASGANVAQGILATVTTKTGENKRGPWFSFRLKIGGEWYGTFDRQVGELAESIQGERVYIEWREDGKYKTVTDISLLGEAPPPIEVIDDDDLPYDPKPPTAAMDEEIPF